MSAMNGVHKRNLDEASVVQPLKRRKLNTNSKHSDGNNKNKTDNSNDNVLSSNAKNTTKTNNNNEYGEHSDKQSGRGAFIVFEGIDRSGKSTQCGKLLSYLSENNIKHEFLRYPDRTSHSGKLIDEYLKGNKTINDRAIHLLFASNRHEDTPKILKLLNDGIHIICDRYSYSGAAYSAAKIAKIQNSNNNNVGNANNNNKNNKNAEKQLANECKSEEIIAIMDNDNNSNNNNNSNNSDYSDASEKENISNGNDINNNNSNTNDNNNNNSMDWEPVMDLDWCLTCEQGLPKPDKIIYLNIDLSEAQKRGGFGTERYEKVDFLKRVQICYQTMQQKYKKQNEISLWQIVDANRTKEEIHKDIVNVVHDTMKNASKKEIKFI